MPEYDYKCPVCGRIEVIRHKMDERPEVICSSCYECACDDCLDGSVCEVCKERGYCAGQRVVMKKLISSGIRITYAGEGWTRKDAANAKAGIPASVAKTAEKLGRL